MPIRRPNGSLGTGGRGGVGDVRLTESLDCDLTPGGKVLESRTSAPITCVRADMTLSSPTEIELMWERV